MKKDPTKDMLKFWDKKTLEELKPLISDPDKWNEEVTPYIKWILTDTPFKLKDLEDKAILEIGCGVGRLMNYFSKHCRSIVGIDISEAMIKESKDYLKRCYNTSTFLIKPPHYQFDLGSREHFDLIYSTIVFQHIHDREIINSYLRQSYDLLNDDGVIRVQTHKGIPSVDGKFHGFAGQMYPSLEDFELEFKKAGFKVTFANQGLGNQEWFWITAVKK